VAETTDDLTPHSVKGSEGHEAGPDTLNANDSGRTGRVLAEIGSMKPQELIQVKRMLGIVDPVRQIEAEQTNDDVRAMVAQFGAVSHPEGFLPAPTEGILSRGPEAVRIFHDRWKNDGVHVTEDTLDYDAEFQAFGDVGGAEQELLKDMGSDYAQAGDAEGLAKLALESPHGDAGVGGLSDRPSATVPE
tara:strand:+ start:1121 stop:1687 length:567 start_codon:yes stop_codon:yes gene_type:complete